MLTGNADDWRNTRLLVSPVPGADPSVVRVNRVANDALVLSLAQLPGYLIDAASMVSNAQLAGLAASCSETLARRLEKQIASCRLFDTL
ncbi:hypothetical protein SDC9_130899 [bioreactor metagenome]|uniref:Uncharacterized protein n=1 Tax=bioreactor metagenome TaxID=1076179 RepID=A0A645D2X7_9ZZZZ